MTISDDDFANLSVMPEEPVERIKYLLAAAEQAVALAQRFRRERNEAQILGRAFRDALVLAQRERDEEQQACDRLRALLREVRESGVEFDAPGVGYVTVQIDRATWAALAAALGECDE